MSLTLDLFVQNALSSIRAQANEARPTPKSAKSDPAMSGIGLFLKCTKESEYVQVGGLYPGGPASLLHERQIDVGDLLIAVDGVDVANRNPESVKDMIQGPSGTQVRKEIPVDQRFTQEMSEKP
jgi:C-terminal processing protease CtpA/Prc